MSPDRRDSSFSKLVIEMGIFRTVWLLANIITIYRVAASPTGGAATRIGSLDNVNKFAPEFNLTEMRGSVPEGSPLGQVVVKITAFDRDSGDEGVITYSLHHNQGMFGIDPISGVVSVASYKTDRETTDIYVLLVQAEDGGGLFSTMTLIITIEDVNDNPPIFGQTTYNAILSENEMYFTRPLQLKATDDDEPGTENSNITYSLSSSSIPPGLAGHFHIDPLTGNITVVQALDFDSISFTPGHPEEITLTALAKDDGLVRLSSTVVITITLVLFGYHDVHMEKGRIFRLPQTVHINAEGGTGRKPDLPCHLLPPHVTWDDRSPSGFWSGKNWNHLLCQMPSLNSLFLEQCFKNKTFFMLGDSNARTLFEAIAKLSNCTLSLAVHPSNLPPHVPKYCDSKILTFHQEWNPHAHPFHNSAPWSFRLVKRSVTFYLDRIPSGGNYVILIHLYLHFQFHHSHLFMLHVRDVVRGVRDLLARNPAAKVVVRGPHAWLPVTGDWHGLRVRRILREEFRELKDKVVYLDFWDMTVAYENALSHPDQYVLNTMTRIFLGHVCS